VPSHSAARAHQRTLLPWRCSRFCRCPPCSFLQLAPHQRLDRPASSPAARSCSSLQYAWMLSCGSTAPSAINALAASSALRCQGCRPGLLLPLQPRPWWSSTLAAAGSPHPAAVTNLRLDVIVPCTQHGSSPSVPTTTSARCDL
jgi:hypothetical protein